MTHQSRKLCTSLRISIVDLRVGMFILELDRPWSQTPFPLQGFLLSELLDLKTLKSLVAEVTIDPSLSDPKSLLHIPWEILHEPLPPPSQIKKSARSSSPAKPLHKSFFNFSWLEAVLEFFTSLAEKSRAKPAGIDAPAQHGKVTRPGRATSQAPAKAEFLRFETPYTSSNSLEDAAQSMLSQQNTETTAAPAHPLPADSTARLRSGSNSKSNKNKLPAPSNPQFSELLQSLYPRDAIFQSLNWLERWQDWKKQRAQKKTYVRGQNIRLRNKTRQSSEYIPPDLTTVSYQDQSSIQQEISYARTVIEKADVVLKRLSIEIKNDRSIALEEVRPTVQLLTDSVISNPDALMWLLRLRSENSKNYARGLKVAVYMMTLGRHLGFSPIQLTEFGFIGLLMDIGKLEIPDTLWDKEGKLAPEEELLMKSHVALGMRMLESGPALSHNIMIGIAEHHERLDGSGYPHGLSGHAISIYGRIAAIADCYAAMTSERPYDITRSSFDAMKELFIMSEDELHAPLVEEFVQAIGIFPVGSMIELSSGAVGIVFEHNKIRRLEPKVLMLTADDKSLLEKPAIIDLMRQKFESEADRIKILRGLPDGAYGLVCRDFYRA